MERLERYIHEMSSPEDALMEELTRTTNQRAVHPQMLSGHIQGRFLGMLVRMLRPHRVLEIGTFTGYSALSMAAGMEAGAILDTIEADDEQEELIRSFVERSGYGDRIRLHIGSALAVMPSLNETYDLVFIDGDKREYPAYYRMLMDEGRTVPLWYGKVAEPEQYRDPHTMAIRAFNRMVREDDRVENVVLPLRDGLNLIRVK